MGGQVGDKGTIVSNFKIFVYDTKKNVGGKIIHDLEVLEGEVKVGDKGIFEIDIKRRKSICKNHTATHMLHEALREVIGEHVNQTGCHMLIQKD